MGYPGSNHTGSISGIDYRPSRCRCGAMIQPFHAVCPRCGRHQNLLFAGLDRLYEEDLDKLIDYHERLVDESPNDYLRIHHLAGAYLLKGDYGAARDLYKKAIAIKPDFAEAHLNLGGILACIGEKEEAVSELREFVRLDIHSPRVERAVRAICSIENIPYEDALRDTGVKDIPARKSRKEKKKKIKGGKPPEEKRVRGIPVRGTMYEPPEIEIRKRRSWGAIDLFFLFLIIIIALGYYFFPGQSRGILTAAVGVMESQFQFTVNSADASEQSGDEAQEDGTGTETDEPAIVNADPGTDSYMPLAAGNTWQYITWDSRDPSGGGSKDNENSVEVRVTGIANAESGVWEVRNGPNLVYYVEKRTGLYSTLSPDFPWSSSYSQVPYPPTEGKTVTDNGQTVTVVGTEVVATSMGMFECVKLHYVDTHYNNLEWYAWYGRGVGLVKYVSGGRNGVYYVRELRYYELN